MATLAKEKDTLAAQLERERENVHNSDAQLEHVMRQVWGRCHLKTPLVKCGVYCAFAD